MKKFIVLMTVAFVFAIVSAQTAPAAPAPAAAPAKAAR